MLVRLEVAHQKANVKKVVLKSDTVIGRSADCNLRIASNEISRRHCQLIVNDGGVSVRDLGSSNGTFIDGNRIEPNVDVSLQPESELSLGGIRFVVRFELPQLPLPMPLAADDPGSTVDLPFVMSETPPPESDHEIDSTLDAANGAAPGFSGKDDEQDVVPTARPVSFPPNNSVQADADETLFAAELAEADTVQNVGLPPAAPVEQQGFPETVNQLANAAADDTIDMRADEFDFASKDEGNTPISPPTVAPSKSDDGKRPAKGWSLFGMFKRKQNADSAEPLPAENASPLGESALDDDEDTYDEDSSADSPVTRHPAPDETTIESEPVLIAEEPQMGDSPEQAEFDPGEMTVIAPVEPESDAAADEDGDDGALGDFLKNL